MSKAYDYIFKLLLIGDGGVGKTALLLRFADGRLCSQMHIMATIGVDFRIRNIEVNGKTIKLQIWDTAGTERFQTITTVYYRAVHGIMIVYDVTNTQSFDHVDERCCGFSWSSQVADFAPSNPIVMLVGNKCDLVDKRKISRAQGEALAARHGWMFTEINSNDADGTDVTQAFTDLASCIAHRFGEGRSFADALDKDDYPAALQLVKRSKVQFTSDQLALVVASACGDSALVARLLVSGVDPNTCFALSGGNTALHIAATKGHITVIKLLVQAGANPHARNTAGKTTLDLASWSVREVIRETETRVHERNRALVHHRGAFSIQQMHGFDGANASML